MNASLFIKAMGKEKSNVKRRELHNLRMAMCIFQKLMEGNREVHFGTSGGAAGEQEVWIVVCEILQHGLGCNFFGVLDRTEFFFNNEVCFVH